MMASLSLRLLCALGLLGIMALPAFDGLASGLESRFIWLCF
ncbi:hypothetical protein [Jejubacter calystegiae]|nr:hypothetical protein [Jejubacter calystegiae]